jgi:hypothetical protein
MPGALIAPRTRTLEPADARIVDGVLVTIAARLNAMAGGPVVVWRSRPVTRAALPPLLQGLAIAAPAVLVEQEVGDPSPVMPAGQLPTTTEVGAVLVMPYTAAERVPAGPWADDLGTPNLEALRDSINLLLHRLRAAGYLEAP